MRKDAQHFKAASQRIAPPAVTTAAVAGNEEEILLLHYNDNTHGLDRIEPAARRYERRAASSARRPLALTVCSAVASSLRILGAYSGTAEIVSVTGTVPETSRRLRVSLCVVRNGFLLLSSPTLRPFLTREATRKIDSGTVPVTETA